MQKNINKYYQMAIYLGRAPLSIGLLIFFMWFITRNSTLLLAGATTILLGLFSVSIGLVSLGIYVYKSKEYGIAKIKILKALTILLINFPIAFLLISISSYLSSTFTIQINNQSHKIITDIHFIEHDKIYKIPDVKAHSKIQHDFHFQSEGKITYSLTIGKEQYTGMLFGYITSGIHGEAQITINSFVKINVDTNTSIM